MNLNDVKRLIRLVESSAIDELEIHEDKLQIRVTKHRPGQAAPVMIPAPAPQVLQAVPAGAQPPRMDASPHGAKVEPAPAPAADNLVEIRSPMVGTFYRSPSPDAAPYVREGDSIQPGKVLCIIEAMKLMNEIEAEITGKIVKILAENAHPVEYNQPLFLVEKG
ncbi:MAG: acetyl-CoA carboxylase biotin carboxyl carrier protein [bacterium]|nr:acetyl-CoA carboxylase biotin carboxyl carrier protein [bacterium]